MFNTFSTDSPPPSVASQHYEDEERTAENCLPIRDLRSFEIRFEFESDVFNKKTSTFLAPFVVELS